MLPNLPNSPITGNSSVRHSDSIEALEIIELYRQQENIEVSKYFEGIVDVDILECGDTGYRFYHPFDIAGDESFYKELGKKAEATGVDYDRDWSGDHSVAQRNLLPSDDLLEIGCNTGKFLDSIKASVASVRGLEFNAIAADKARSRGLEVLNESIENYAENHPGKFDVVCAFQVLEHVTTVESFLRSAFKALKPNGRLILSVPNNDPYFQRFNKYEVMNLPPHHMGLWNFKAFNKLTDVFEIELIDHAYSGAASFKGDVYLRARYMARVKSPPVHHTRVEKLMIFSMIPLAIFASTMDHIRGRKNFGHITVTFKKRWV